MFRSIGYAALACSLLVSVPASAETDWPSKPINLVYAFTAGGGTDQMMLPLRPLLEERLGQSILMNYRPGGNGQVGFESVFLAGDDGYTIGILQEPHFTNTTIYQTPRYKHDDMTPVGIINRDVPMWFVSKDSPIQDMNDLIEEARQRPGEVSVAVGNFTSEQYLTLAILEEQAGVEFRPVSVIGGSEPLTNVIGGHMVAGISRPSTAYSLKDDIRAIGVVGSKRSELFPDAQTFDEQLPESIRIPHVSTARGLMVTTTFATENPEAFEKLEAAVRDAVFSDEYKEAMDRLGFAIDWVPSDVARDELNANYQEVQKYKELIEAAPSRQ